VSAVMIAISVFLFLINVFSGLNHIWFHWPVAALLLIAFLRAAFPRKPS
jgi:adenylate cyclase